MDCPTEEALIRKKLGGMDGIVALDFNLMQRVLSVSHTLPDTRSIEQALQHIDMHAVKQTSTLNTSRIAIQEMDCPTEEALIRKKLGGMQAVDEMQFNLMARVLTVAHAPNALPDIVAALQSLSFNPQVLDSNTAVAATTEPAPATESKPYKKYLLGAALVAAMAAEAINFAGGSTLIEMLLAAFAILASGLKTYQKGWIALKNLNLNINALMAIAVTGAVLIGHWPEAAMVMVLFTIAELIEAKSLDRARNAIRGLLDLSPEKATVLQADGSWQQVLASAVAIGDTVRVKPGERLAVDGVLTSGTSSINQAPITGESLPVEKNIGDTVFAGTINEAGSFEYRVSAAANHSTLARIIAAVESAQGSRAPTQRFVDQFSKWYTPIVFVIALLVAIVPPLLLGGAWSEWFYRALVMLVIACPCALVISTPVSIVSGLSAAAKKGILIKGGVYLEQGKDLQWLALDKTGTITHGKPVLTDMLSLQADLAAQNQQWAASLAARSDHPVSKAIAQAAQEQGVNVLSVDDFAALAGRGTQGQINGENLFLGNTRLLQEQGLLTPDLAAQIDALEQQGKTVVTLMNAQHALALFAVADTIKDSSTRAITELHELGIKTIMLTGDNQHTATAIAAQAGIDAAKGNMLPEHKLAEIAGLAAHSKVGMVGDGINDTPALARADIGFAMGAAGADTAIETADVALMDDDLRKIPQFIRLSQATSAILKQNIALALGIKAVFLVLTFTGDATMWMAVFADMGASLLVVGNGLRLLKK
ncbi:heavy metal translocating P-type ATPase [Vitreoscilla massiliensis]|uniref:P-type Zn(2+) transporter n=2 Tax=Vitreoscilla massiliensis TaxID=1689272 RepID=A0ABY4E743_9NEIS|nr:heavy metal translocating P-type ATPase [Vitreoscilla massiliensis]UOO91277.1 heavy metal translocating P-type ATPase [Vitreoscilla massiliensis]